MNVNERLELEPIDQAKLQDAMESSAWDTLEYMLVGNKLTWMGLLAKTKDEMTFRLIQGRILQIEDLLSLKSTFKSSKQTVEPS